MKTILPFKRKAWIRWKPLEHSKIKINIDGAAKGNPGPAGANCLLRDYQGQWIARVTQNLGSSIATSAEL